MELHVTRCPLRQASGQGSNSPSCVAPALPQEPELTCQRQCMARQAACHLDALCLGSETLNIYYARADTINVLACEAAPQGASPCRESIRQGAQARATPCRV